MSNLWNGFRDLFVEALDLLHGLFAFIGDEPAWGFAIIALTLVVRILMLPLAIKQTHSMRAMQELQPKIKEIQKKYKADRELMKKDPERYKTLRQKQNEEMQALYQEAGVNPAGGCLPLLAQAPIFIALFSVLRSTDLQSSTALTNLLSADFYFFTPSCPDPLPQAALQGNEPLACGLSTGASAAGFWGIALILLMAGSMFFSQRQMIAKSSTEGTQAQQQKIMMYVMPVFLAVVSFNFPMGVLLYWVTTNVWQIAQQAIVLHEVDVAAPGRKGGTGNGKDGATGAGKAPDSRGKGSAGDGKGSAGKGTAAKGGRGRGKGSASGTSADGATKTNSSPPASGKTAKGGGQKGAANPNGPPRPKRSNDHLPTRRSRGERG